MTQVINFEELKAAFEPKIPAKVVSLHSIGTDSAMQIEQYMDTPVKAEADSEMIKLKEQLNELRQALQLSAAKNETLSQDQIHSSNHLQRLTEDKMRLVRQQGKRQSEFDRISRSLNSAGFTNEKLMAKLNHAKNDNRKLNRKNLALVSENQTLSNQLEQQAKELTKLADQINKPQVKQQFQMLWARIQNMLVRSKERFDAFKPSSEAALPAFQWQSTTKQLPAKYCTVYVRNRSDSGIAIYNPEKQTFKCMGSPIEIIEWAHIQ